MTRLAAERLRAGYGWRQVLGGLDLAFDAATLTAVVGPNGSGKSTLLRCLAGLLRPRGGRVTLDGIDLAELDRAAIARRVAVVPQAVETIFPFSVREVVALGRTARLGPLAIAQASDGAAVDRVLRENDLVELADRPIDTISGGERQRAVLAMALAQEGEVLLLDEPTVHLDPAHQRAILERVRALARSRSLVALAVLHDLNLAAAMCDRVVVLNSGVVAADGRPAEVLEEATVRAVFGPHLDVGTRDGVPYVLPAP